MKFERIIGVFNLLTKASERAAEYATQSGLSNTDIVDIVSSFGYAGPKPIATRRAWPNGTSEVRVLSCRTDLKWIKVLPKELTAPSGKTDFKTAYLALDRSGGLFVIGAYTSKDEAWEACRKYWTQLSYCSAIQNMEQWYDEKCMFHAQGALGGMIHHWFVEPYDINGRVE